MSKEPREYFEDKCAARINEIKAELDELEYSSENVPWDPGADEYREIANLRFQVQDLEKKLHEMRTAVDVLWPTFRDEMEAGLSALGQAVGQKLSAGNR
jgi:DNA repair ATPase RecN